MKSLFFSSLALLFSLFTVNAQQPNPPPAGGSWNPYLIQGVVSPAPMIPAEFNGTGTLTFDVGNTGSSDIVWVTNQEMLLTISLSYGVPNVANPNDPAQAITAVTGPGAAWFSWEYFPAQNTLRGRQKATIPGSSRQTINIAYKVTKNSFFGASYQNGYNVNISPPGYTNPQPTNDDTVAAYTYVRAYDFSDAPTSYGSSSHEIAVKKVTTQDEFNNDVVVYDKYVYFGDSVDPESASQSSTLAFGDDLNASSGTSVDDEDGVTIPALIRGQSTTITYKVIVADELYFTSVLKFSAWIDWNRDGDFLDTGERVATNIDTPLSGTYTHTFTVPAGASLGTTYARFRIGPSVSSSTAAAAYGEVEDYVVTVSDTTGTATAGTVSGRIYKDINGNGTQGPGEPNLPDVSVSITASNNSVQSVTTDANGNWSALVPTGSTTVDINNADPDLPAGATLTQGIDPLIVTVLPNQNANGGIAGFFQSGYSTWQAKNSTSGGMNEDHDKDCVPNGLEYFLMGSTVTSTGPTLLPSITKQAGIMSITWTRAADYKGVYGTDFVIESSSTLMSPWTPEPLGVHVNISGNNVTYTFPPPYLDKFFVRMRVTGPNP